MPTGPPFRRCSAQRTTLDALIAAGCSKVNLSTALREAVMTAFRRSVADATSTDPFAVMTAVREAARTVAAATMDRFGSTGRAVG